MHMVQITKRWLIAPRLSPEQNTALSEFDPIMRQLLVNRGFTTPFDAKTYLHATPPTDTQPMKMSGMAAGSDRIANAIRKRESIAVYGDYDADGVSACALLTQALDDLDAEVQVYIPNRFEEGYGLNKKALRSLKDQGVKLVITVDCGVRDLEEVAYAREIGLELIITDHHHPGAELPDAVAVINPKQEGDDYPEKNLSGVGLAYKLAEAIYLEHYDKTPEDVEKFLDLVALGTVADLVPLTGENRALVRAGIDKLRHPQRQGLQALMGISGLQPKQINAEHIGFALGPRINAAGRLTTALSAYYLLTAKDVATAGRLAQELDNQNRTRQRITRDMQAEALRIALQKGPQAYLLAAAHEEFNPGVVGLAAARLVDAQYRPSIVGHIGEEYTRASCRSIPEFHITKALDKCQDLLERHGGHAAAAGFTVRNENYDLLIEQLNSIAISELSDLDLRPTLNVDSEVQLASLQSQLLNNLEQLQPTGQGNPKASFVSRGLIVKKSQLVGHDKNHLKLSVTDGKITFDAIAFRQGHWYAQMPDFIDLLYNFEINEFGGRQYLQLNVKDIKDSQLPH